MVLTAEEGEKSANKGEKRGRAKGKKRNYIMVTGLLR